MTGGHPYDWRAIVSRLLLALLLVFSIYNPSGYSYWHWVVSPEGNPWAKAFLGVLLLGLHVLIWKAVMAVLRVWGALFIVAIGVGGFVGLSEIGLVDRTDPNAIAMGVMFTLVLLLTAGLSLPSIMHRLTGVQHVEEIPH